ncbi:MAG: hypothetical protein ACREBB_06010 [Nitrosotalea sp.]
MDQKRKKTINKFAVLVVLMILVPELAGHFFFDKPHSASSSVNTAVALTNKMDKGYPITNFGCHLTLQNDPSSSNISRAVGLEGKYGRYSCQYS